MHTVYIFRPQKKYTGSHGNHCAHIQAHLLRIVLISLALIALISISMAAFIKQASVPWVIFQTFPPGGSVWPATLICPSAATESLIRPERGIELLRDEDMTSWAHLMSMIGQLTCRSGILPACCSPWILNCRLWTEANRTDDIRGSPVTCCLRTE